MQGMSLNICFFTFGFSVEATSLFHLFRHFCLCHPSTNHYISCYCCCTIHISFICYQPYVGQRRVNQSEISECSTPPASQPASTSSTLSYCRTSRRSHSSESDLLERLCECGDMNAQIFKRLECVISNYDAQSNDCTAWVIWMTRALGKIHEEVWPSFQQRSMDLVNLVLHESTDVADREQHKASLQLDEKQRQPDQHQPDLELKERQTEVM